MFISVAFSNSQKAIRIQLNLNLIKNYSVKHSSSLILPNKKQCLKDLVAFRLGTGAKLFLLFYG